MNIEDAILQDLTEEYINTDSLLAREEWDTYTYKKLPVPRVSHVLKACTMSIEPLMKWASRLGFKHIDYIVARNTAAKKGTLIHNAIEAFIKDRKVPDYYKVSDEDVKQALYNGFEGFASFWNNFRYKDEIASVKMEETIVTPYYGGTYDLLITLKDGRNMLYDFKTSNHLKWEHFVQLAAYKYSLENYYNTPICSTGILLIDKYKPSCKEYILDFTIPENVAYIDQCQKCFISMLYTYYNSIAVSEGFDKLRKTLLYK